MTAQFDSQILEWFREKVPRWTFLDRSFRENISGMKVPRWNFREIIYDTMFSKFYVPIKMFRKMEFQKNCDISTLHPIVFFYSEVSRVLYLHGIWYIGRQWLFEKMFGLAIQLASRFHISHPFELLFKSITDCRHQFSHILSLYTCLSSPFQNICSTLTLASISLKTMRVAVASRRYPWSWWERREDETSSWHERSGPTRIITYRIRD